MRQLAVISLKRPFAIEKEKSICTECFMHKVLENLFFSPHQAVLWRTRGLVALVINLCSKNAFRLN